MTTRTAQTRTLCLVSAVLTCFLLIPILSSLTHEDTHVTDYRYYDTDTQYYDIDTRTMSLANDLSETNNIEDTGIRYNTILTDDLDIDTSRVFYNRVPKCGSTSVVDFLELAAQSHRVATKHSMYTRVPHFERKDQVDAFLRYYYAFPTPLMFNRHLHFFQFESYKHKLPIYINFIRDPLDRLHSFYYFRRFTNPRDLSEAAKNRTYDECVLGGYSECVNPNGPDAETGWWSIIPYFCGQDPLCLEPTVEALEQAKYNVVRYYKLVGVLTHLHQFIDALECLLPEFYTGAYDIMINSETKLQLQSKTNIKPAYSQEVETIMKEKLHLEYEFYEFVRQRFNFIYQSLNCTKRNVT